MKYIIIYTQTALDSYDDIFDYIAQDSPIMAAEFTTALRMASKTFLSFRLRGSKVK